MTQESLLSQSHNQLQQTTVHRVITLFHSLPLLFSADGGQDQKGKETVKSSCGRQQTEEELKAEQSTR